MSYDFCGIAHLLSGEFTCSLDHVTFSLSHVTFSVVQTVQVQLCEHERTSSGRLGQQQTDSSEDPQ